MLVLLILWAAFSPQGAATQTTLRIASYNIKHGLGMDGVVDLVRVAEVLRRLSADVIALQEVDNGVERTDGVDQVARLGELLGMRGFHGAFRPFQGGEYGVGILTRLPVTRIRTLPIPPGPEGALAVLEVQVAIGSPARPVSVVALHFYRSPEERRAQADSVTSYYVDADYPVVLAGDFNSRRGDLVLTRLEREWTVLPKSGDPNTYPADAPDREIDFLMYRPAGAFEVLEHRVIDEPLASDHRPVLAVLRIW
jgi:endonuclease/exonuclease/phosphatase family metal-dependent hydrolase